MKIAGLFLGEMALGNIAIAEERRARKLWTVMHTENFRVHSRNMETRKTHHIGEIFESTRREIHDSWCDSPLDSWSPKCAVYLHPTKQSYARETKGDPATSSGHSSSYIIDGQVTSRRIDAWTGHNAFLTGVLPHETAHVIVQNEFRKKPAPRWADEGIAILAESPGEQLAHNKNLWQFRGLGLFPLSDLCSMQNYPSDDNHNALFYAQSVSLVKFMSERINRPTFMRFLHDGEENGYNWAAQEHYKLTLPELDEQWEEETFGV